MNLNYIEYLLLLALAVPGCVWLVAAPVGIKSTATGLTNFE